MSPNRCRGFVCGNLSPMLANARLDGVDRRDRRKLSAGRTMAPGLCVTEPRHNAKTNLSAPTWPLRFAVDEDT